jgi:glutamyl-tRNA synthetase
VSLLEYKAKFTYNARMVRTRIAPSPTGYPHIGTIYQALFDFAYAKKHEGTFLVRIEDTDRGRFIAGAEEVIFQALDWFGLSEDESVRKGGEHGPYRQSERLEIYHKYAQELVDKDLAYFAYYPKEDAGQKKDYSVKASTSLSQKVLETTDEPPKTIEEMIKRGDWILRMRVPKDKETIIKDEIRGEIVFAPDQVTEQVLVKSDGYPTYHLAAVVDDHEMGVTHVVRGEEWISSTPKHVLLYQYFGWDIPLFFHTPLLRNPDKSKLSKRHGHTSVTWYQEEGFLPGAILNFLALMGWTHPEEKEIFSLEEFINVFELKDIRQVGPIFDLTKLTWMNGEYIRAMEVSALGKALMNYEKQFGTHAEQLNQIEKNRYEQLVALGQSRIATLKEFTSLLNAFLPNATFHVSSDQDKAIASSMKEAFESISDWNKDTLMDAMRIILKTHSIRMPVLYTIVTGQERGLPLPESLAILGKETVLARLDHALQS